MNNNMATFPFSIYPGQLQVRKAIRGSPLGDLGWGALFRPSLSFFFVYPEPTVLEAFALGTCVLFFCFFLRAGHLSCVVGIAWPRMLFVGCVVALCCFASWSVDQRHDGFPCLRPLLRSGPARSNEENVSAARGEGAAWESWPKLGH